MKKHLACVFVWLLAVFPAFPAILKPNIILVMTDDQGYGDLGFTGNPIIKTPFIDGFAREAVRFTDFHVSPTCAPTRSALLTGRHEFKNGVTHTVYERERLTLKATTLAQVIKRAGYATGIFGKWHLGDETAYRPDRRGFDEVFIHGGGGIGQSYAGTCGDAPGNTYFNPAIYHNGRFVKTTGYCTDLFFSQATHWMEQRRKASAPFFAYIALNAPHGPLQCPEAYYKRHRGQVSDMVAKYYGMIENVDDRFGELLARLREWGISQNTLVIFMTDNGGTVATDIYNAGMRGSKNTPYQGGTRVPAFWRWPAGFTGGLDCRALAGHIDVLPTFAEIVGYPLDASLRQQVEGISLLGLLRAPQSPTANRFWVTHIGRWERGQAAGAKWSGTSIRDQRFTLVNGTELYDLENDPGEKTNCLAQYPDMVARMRAAYEQWWIDVQPGLVNEWVHPPKMNPMKALYWKQFGGGPDEALRRLMDPEFSSYYQAAASLTPAAPRKAVAP